MVDNKEDTRPKNSNKLSNIAKLFDLQMLINKKKSTSSETRKTQLKVLIDTNFKKSSQAIYIAQSLKFIIIYLKAHFILHPPSGYYLSLFFHTMLIRQANKFWFFINNYSHNNRSQYQCKKP